jgi:ubiquinone/menaquinone biosynthesis C-methylase UbiE
MELSDRIRALFDHLGIERAHFAGGSMAPALPTMCGAAPEIVSSLTLVLPQSLSSAVVGALQCPLAVITGDTGATARRLIPFLEANSPHTQVVLDDYNAVAWADVAGDRGDPLIETLHRFHAAIDDSKVLRKIGPIQESGCVAEVYFRSLGKGPPLVLFPLCLSPGQWDPVLDQLSKNYCVLLVHGAHIEPASALEARGRNPGYRDVVGSMIAMLNLEPNSRLLEVGCGSGAVSRWIAEQATGKIHVTGLDVNKFLLSEAMLLRDGATKKNMIEFHEGNAEQIPFPDDSFDAAVSVTMLEEVDADRAIAEMVRVTRPGGCVGAVTRSVDMVPVVSAPLNENILAKLRQVSGSISPGGCADASLYQRFRNAGLINLQKKPQFNMTSHLVDNTRGRISLVLDAEEMEAWDEITSANDGASFYAQPFHVAVGIKPEQCV